MLFKSIKWYEKYDTCQKNEACSDEIALVLFKSIKWYEKYDTCQKNEAHQFFGDYRECSSFQ